MKNKKSYIIPFIIIAVIYLLIGVGYNMQGERRLATKYNSEFPSSDAFVRSIIFSPFWPMFMTATIKNCGDLQGTGCPVVPFPK